MFIKNFIDGQWVDSRAGETFERSNPANTAEVVAVVSKADTGDVDMAVAAAKEAFAGWRHTPAPKRGEILFRAGGILMKRKNELGELMTREMGKVLTEALGDVQEAAASKLRLGELNDRRRDPDAL